MQDYNCETCDNCPMEGFNPEIEAYSMIEIFDECEDVAAIEISNGKIPSTSQLFEMSEVFHKEGYVAKYEFFSEEKKILVHINKI